MQQQMVRDRSHDPLPQQEGTPTFSRASPRKYVKRYRRLSATLEAGKGEKTVSRVRPFHLKNFFAYKLFLLFSLFLL
jgi:hypothetical protein